MSAVDTAHLYRGGCGNPHCACATPGPVCQEWMGIEGEPPSPYCPRCGWHRKVHPPENALTVAGARELSRLLFEAREQVAMWADVVRRNGGADTSKADEVRDALDAYRARRGWNPDGFGGEFD